ncbi:hypothetical protein CN689_05595 [Peribacillus butanolivorans]|uniref:Uncharacterized protein n=1 Tax=Peribacillus butanolivorans TaxID=421767 RepID=A0AAX0S6V7_9BACI|nr:hypothetical protein [Peribacillus butanolivorans]PEJ35932.1 hypothetical protein CN689_05595 [Peribacillus butanolivorans]
MDLGLNKRARSYKTNFENGLKIEEMKNSPNLIKDISKPTSNSYFFTYLLLFIKKNIKEGEQIIWMTCSPSFLE